MSGVTCPICQSFVCAIRWAGATGFEISAEGAFSCTTTVRTRPEVWICSECKHLFTNPNDWPVDLSSEYELLEDPDYLDMLAAKRKTFKRAGNLVEKYLPPPARLLEIGSYAGVFLSEMNSRGYSVCGVEPSAWGVEVARGNSLKVLQGTADTAVAAFQHGSFDGVVSWDVLEHVPDPRKFINGLATLVRPGGLVFLSTLDRKNWFARVLGRRWPWVIPMHLHYFDQATVNALASECGLVFLATGPHVHYSTISYSVSRLIGRPRQVGKAGTLLDEIPIPFGFGDVRYFVYRRPLA